MKKGYWYIAATAFLFSTAEIASKFMAGKLDPFQLVLLRFFIGGLFLLPFALAELKRRGLKLGWNDLLYFTLTGFLGVTVSMSLFQMALVYADASVVAVIFSVNTVFTSLFAVLFLKERFTWQSAAALALGLLGVGAMLFPFTGGAGALGVVLTLLAAAVFSLFGVIGTRRVARYGGFILNSFSFLAGVALLLPFMLALGKPILAGLDWSTLPVVAYYGVFVTGLGYFFYLSAMRETGAIQTSAVFFIKPALAPLLAWIVLGETIGPGKLAGMAMIVAGALVLFWRRVSEKKGSAKPLEKTYK